MISGEIDVYSPYPTLDVFSVDREVESNDLKGLRRLGSLHGAVEPVLRYNNEGELRHVYVSRLLEAGANSLYFKVLLKVRPEIYRHYLNSRPATSE